MAGRGAEDGREVVTASDDSVVGRERELAAVEEFLGGGTTSSALLFTGGPGIGKTALWERGRRLAQVRGIRVLAARPSGTEAELSFATLFDLLEGIDIGAIGGLPVPQRQALEAALLRTELTGEPPERFAVAAGFLNVLRSLAASGPLIIAVDDVPWLDAASAEVLGFAARRARGQRIRFLLARRSGSAARVESDLGPARVHRIEVGPLCLGATRRLLSQCLRLTLPPRTFRRLFDATQGNPLLALELGRALAVGRTWPIGSGPPVAELAGNPFGDRVAGLPRPAYRALLATALSGHLSLSQLVAVLEEVRPVSANDVWAVGGYLRGATNKTLILHWNGTSWVQVPSPSLGTNDGLFGVDTTSPGNVWAVGGYALGGTSLTLAVHCC